MSNQVKRRVIYHDPCVDGFASAWFAWRKFGDDNTTYMPASYGSDAPNVTGEEVYIVDFSYPREDLIRMHEQAESLIVLDHHASAESRLQGLDYCTFDMNRSGAKMSADYFGEMDEHAVMLANYVQDRDLWRFELPQSRIRTNAIYSWPYDFQYWNDQLKNGMLDMLTTEGRALTRLHDRFIEEIARNAYWASIEEGVRVPVVNVYVDRVSDVLNKLAADNLDAPYALGWYQDASLTYRYSLRCVRDDVHVNDVAAKFGGGGHPKAAGFASQEKLV